jgi:hypothetical protein
MNLFNNPYRVYLIALSFSMPLILGGCGSSQSITEKASLSCRTGVKALKKKYSPELSKLISITPLPISNSQFGCVLVYTKVLEELPGEVLGVYTSTSQPHELAFIIPDVEGRLVLTQPNIPTHRRGIVEMQVKLAEIHNDDIPEVIVEEREIGSRDQIYAMRVFLYAEGVPAPKEIFSERMSYKTSGGVERPAEWLVGESEGLPAIFVKGKHSKKENVYMWHESLQTYQFDLAVTQRRALSSIAAQPKLSKPDHPRKASTKSSIPTSLVSVIGNKSPQKSPEQETPKPKTKEDETPRPSESTPTKDQKKVTTVNEFLEGL